MIELNAYFFTNMYISSIQHGIQSAHCLAEMFLEHKDNPILLDWAKNHKTIRILDGGTLDNMNMIYDVMLSIDDMPLSVFREPSMGELMTCVGFVLPPHMQDFINDAKNPTASDINKFIFGSNTLTPAELMLCNLIIKARPAR